MEQFVKMKYIWVIELAYEYKCNANDAGMLDNQEKGVWKIGVPDKFMNN